MRRLLLQLYPARWRARYGDEFELILKERPLGPFDVADIVLSALDAHLHLRGIDAASEHRKGFAMTLRIGGYAAILGGLLWFVVLAANAVNDGNDSGAFFWIGPVLLAAIVTTLVALIGLSAFQARRYPVLMWTAFAVPAIGAVVSLLGAVAMAVVGDGDRAIVGGLSGWFISTMGVMGLLLGSGLFALATWRAQSLSRAAAALLATGVILLVAGLSGLSMTFVPAEAAGIMLFASIVVFPAGWAAMGVSALRTDRSGSAFEGATS